MLPAGRSRNRARVLAGIALAAAVIVLPCALTSRSYGPLITPDRLAEFPEAGPGGRYKAPDAPPFPGFARTVGTVVHDSIPAEGKPLWPAAQRWLEGSQARLQWVLLSGSCCSPGIGYLRLASVFDPARRALALPLAATAGYFLSVRFPPFLYIPQRYVLFALPPMLAVVLATGGAAILGSRSRTRWRFRRFVVPALGLVCLCLLGGRGSRSEGLASYEDRGRFYRCLASLPPDSMIAGWPSGTIDDVPYFSRRRALVTFETLQAFHVQYTLEMRRRTNAVIEAYFAAEPGPLVRLRDEFGVTHLLVDLEILRGREAEPPGPDPTALFPFQPFDATTRSALDRARGRTLEVLRQLPRAGSVSRRTLRRLGAVSPRSRRLRSGAAQSELSQRDPDNSRGERAVPEAGYRVFRPLPVSPRTGRLNGVPQERPIIEHSHAPGKV